MLEDVLKDLRKKSGYTQEEVALKINVSRQAVAKWEKGNSIPDIYNCKALSELYQVDLNDLIKSDEKNASQLNPKGKYMLGKVCLENGFLKVPEECIKILNLKEGQEFLCFVDVNEGIAFTNYEKYKEFAKKILNWEMK